MQGLRIHPFEPVIFFNFHFATRLFNMATLLAHWDPSFHRTGIYDGSFPRFLRSFSHKK